VKIAGTNYTPPSFEQLPHIFEDMIQTANSIEDNYDKAIYVFLEMSKNQFFYDVNKRMGRFMMNGILISTGFPTINLPAKRQLEFNQLMLNFYNNEDRDPMNRFMRSCLDPRSIEIMLE